MHTTDPIRHSVDRENVRGVSLDEQSRCIHYHGPTDIVAIKFKCCGEYYACKDCHIALADHAIEVWPESEWATPAIRCGVCGTSSTILDYLTSGSQCRHCAARFNPGCKNHHHFYFAVPMSPFKAARHAD